MSRSRSLKGNAYLEIAKEALIRERRPLTPHEMLELARQGQFLPDHLYGLTMHRTLNARLSEHIRNESDKSSFFRTGPSTFYMHSLADLPGTPEEYRKVHVGNLRSKAIRKENVLVAPRVALSRLVYGDFVPFNEREFEEMFRTICFFKDRQRAEGDDNVKQFVTFTLVHYGRLLLIYRRGKFTTTSDTLKGQLSVGFGGHVNDRDFDLFNQGESAFRANAARELREELFLDDIYERQDETFDRSHVMGYINVDESADAEHHIAVLVRFDHGSGELPKKGELSINQLDWLDLDRPRNDLSEFDLWSGMILGNIYNGKIRI